MNIRTVHHGGNSTVRVTLRAAPREKLGDCKSLAVVLIALNKVSRRARLNFTNTSMAGYTCQLRNVANADRSRFDGDEFA